MWFNKKGKTDNKKDNDPEKLLALDIGTYKIRLIEGSVTPEGEILITYFSEKESAGMKRSAVSDLNLLTKVISELAGEYEERTNKKFAHCIVGISGLYTVSRNEFGETTVPSHTVTETDRKNVLQHAGAISLGDNMHIMHVIPQGYMTDSMNDDSQNNVSNPVGLRTMRLRAGVHLIACNEDRENDLRRAVEQVSADACADFMVCSGLAAADAVLSNEDKEIGVCVIDIGEGSTNIVLYHDGKLVMSCGIQPSGNDITRKISADCGITLNDSDYIKRDFGVAHIKYVSEDDPSILVQPPSPVNSDDVITITRECLAGNINYSLTNLLNIAKNRIEEYSNANKEPFMIGAGFVLTGGTAQLRNITAVASTNLAPTKIPMAVRTRIGLPRSISKNSVTMLNSPEYATAVGLLKRGFIQRSEENAELRMLAERKRQSQGISKLARTIKDWLSSEL